MIRGLKAEFEESDNYIDAPLTAAISIHFETSVDIGVDIDIDIGVDIVVDIDIDVDIDIGVDIDIDIGVDIGVDIDIDIDIGVSNAFQTKYCIYKSNVSNPVHPPSWIDDWTPEIGFVLMTLMTSPLMTCFFFLF